MLLALAPVPAINRVSLVREQEYHFLRVPWNLRAVCVIALQVPVPGAGKGTLRGGGERNGGDFVGGVGGGVGDGGGVDGHVDDEEQQRRDTLCCCLLSGASDSSSSLSAVLN